MANTVADIKRWTDVKSVVGNDNVTFQDVVFDSVGEFTVRYKLMRDLYLEAVSGLDSAVDILYQFEFD